jgi:hypothetical protein
MSPGSGSTGFVLEQMVLPALRNGGYETNSQVHVGQRLNGGKHFADVVAGKDGRRFLISLKWQQVSGTAEQKVPFEVICLAETVSKEKFDRAYLVLGGEGWTLREFFTGGGLRKHLLRADMVAIVTLEGFIALANKGKL